MHVGHELAESFALGWPQVLANLAQAARTATDVMLSWRRWVLSHPARHRSPG